MEGQVIFFLFFIFFFLVNSVTRSNAADITSETPHLESFPKEFIFGTATSAYQNEGATKEGGRGISTWDTFIKNFPGKIEDRSNADVAVDSYHRYKEDVKLIKEMGMNGYRFSISWPRILPEGKLSKGVNKEGVTYYNNLIDELLSNGIEPFVTLFHWDLPQTLEDEYGSFLSPKIVDDFKDYAEVCYKEFGDRVKHWITFNEPWTFIWGGYATGLMAPGRCSSFMNCAHGDSGREPYVVAHNLLLSHAAAANLYKDKYQATQKGKIGITLNTDWVVPSSDKTEDHDAAVRSLDFSFGWFLEPLTDGEYPQNMRNIVKDRLPQISKEELMKIKGSFDFIGLNYYSTSCAVNVPQQDDNPNPTYINDPHANLTEKRNGVPIGPKAASPWLNVYPQGLREFLLHIKDKYKNPVIYITENGYSTHDKTSLEESLKDDKRVDYYTRHLFYLQQAIKDGVDVRGYFAWTLMDNYEWTSGFKTTFGLYYVDRKDGLKRYPKDSSKWFKNFLQLSSKPNTEL